MADFETKCPHCGVGLIAQEEWIGMNVECPECKKHFEIERISDSVSITNAPAENNGFRKRKWYVLSAVVLSAIAVAVIIIACLVGNSNETESTGNSGQTETAAVQKPKYAGLHFSFKWGYLVDDLDQTEFKSLEQIADYGFTLQYNAVTKDNFRYSIVVEKSSRKIQLISSEDSSTIDSYITDNQFILDRKAMENDKAVCYHSGRIALFVNKQNKNVRFFMIKENDSYDVEIYFNVVLKSWGM